MQISSHKSEKHDHSEDSRLDNSEQFYEENQIDKFMISKDDWLLCEGFLSVFIGRTGNKQGVKFKRGLLEANS